MRRTACTDGVALTAAFKGNFPQQVPMELRDPASRNWRELGGARLQRLQRQRDALPAADA
jgi:hypothetical protein